MQQCRLLEQHFDTNYLGVCLENSTDAAQAIQEAKTDILRKDWNRTVREARTHPHLPLSVSLTSSQQVGTAPGTKHLNLVFVAQG